MKKTLRKIKSNGIDYTFLNLPNTEVFKYEVVQKIGGNIERILGGYGDDFTKRMYGASHLIEHMSFKQGIDYNTEAIKELLKEFGECNASTDHEEVRYYCKGLMQHREGIVNLINNIALNDLTKVPEEEFLVERDIVCNEAKIYYDNPHTKFYFDETTSTFGLDIENNVIGSLATIKGLDLNDLVRLKGLVNARENQSINVVYDGTLVSESELLEGIEENLKKFNLTSMPEVEGVYVKNLPKMVQGVRSIHTAAEQVLYSFTFEMPGENRTDVLKALDFFNDFSRYSLTEEVREKRGLTYHIGSSSLRMGRKDYYQIYCDIEPGNEGELLEGVSEAFEKSILELDEATFEKFKTAMLMRRKLGFLDLNKYMSYIREVNENVEFYERHRVDFEEDMDRVVNRLDEEFVLDKARSILEDARAKFLAKEGSEVWGVKGCDA